MQFAVHHEYRHVGQRQPEQREGRLAHCIKVTPVWLCCLIALLAVVNVLLFAELLRSDRAEPPPPQDFARIANRQQYSYSYGSSSGSRGRHALSAGSHYRRRCTCNPRLERSQRMHCTIGPRGNMQQRFVNRDEAGGAPPLYKCTIVRTPEDDGRHPTCQCCDCGTDNKEVLLDARSIRRYAKACAQCEAPADAGAGAGSGSGANEVVFGGQPQSVPPAGGARAGAEAKEGAGVRDDATILRGFESGSRLEHQLLFKVPLGIRYDFDAFRAEVVVEGDFKRTADNDPIVGLLDLDDDGTGTVWAAQRGDNGIWFSIGKFSPHVASKEAGDEAGGARATFDPHAMHFAQHGSRAARFGITVEHHSKGSGRTVFTMDNDLMDHHGAYDKVATWERRGWAAKGKASALYLVAFRDDTNEQYAFRSVTVRYQKL